MVLVKLADVLCLNYAERKLWFDIAAKDNQQRNNNVHIPVDVLIYLSNRKSACEVIRKADELNYSDEFWTELLKKL